MHICLPYNCHSGWQAIYHCQVMRERWVCELAHFFYYFICTLYVLFKYHYLLRTTCCKRVIFSLFDCSPSFHLLFYIKYNFHSHFQKKVLCSLTIQNLFLKVFWDLSVYYAELFKMVSQHLKTSWYVISEVRSSQFFVTWTRLCNIVSTSRSLNKH